MSRGLAMGAGVGLAAMLALAAPVGTALGTLAGARAERDRLARAPAQHRPAAPLVAPALAMRAPDGRRAGAELTARLRAHATAAGLLVERAEAVRPAGAGLAAAALRVSGNEHAVIGFAEALQRGRPLVRWQAWTMSGTGSSAVRLEGEVIAPWR